MAKLYDVNTTSIIPCLLPQFSPSLAHTIYSSGFFSFGTFPKIRAISKHFPYDVWYVCILHLHVAVNQVGNNALNTTYSAVLAQ